MQKTKRTKNEAKTKPPADHVEPKNEGFGNEKRNLFDVGPVWGFSDSMVDNGSDDDDSDDDVVYVFVVTSLHR